MNCIGLSRNTFQINAVITLIAIVAVVVHVFAIIANDDYEYTNKSIRLRLFFPLMGEIAVLVGFSNSRLEF